MTFHRGLQQAEKAIDTLLNLISRRLGLDHDWVLGGRYGFPLMARYLMQRGGHMADYTECDKLLYRYIQTFLWGRYTGFIESVLNQDLAVIKVPDGALDRLINQLLQNRGDLRLSANDFMGWSLGARFYPLLYMLTRVCHAQDWETGVELSNRLLGKLNRLQVHHIFPKALLYQHGYSKADVNAIANLTFLPQDTNLRVSDRDPTEYLEAFARTQPGAVASHWIPMDRDLWRVENYHAFLAARRKRLAQAANGFLDSLLAGVVPESATSPSGLEHGVVMVPGGVESAEEEWLIQECNAWVVQHGLPEGEYLYELTNALTGEPLAMLDLAWPNGLQEGYSQPVALLIDASQETEEAAKRAGYRYFTDVHAFRAYVQQDILALHSASEEGIASSREAMEHDWLNAAD